MRVVLLSALVAALSACATAPVPSAPAPAPAPTPAPAAPAAAEAQKASPLQLSQALCKHGIFGFHFKTEGPTEGNVYFRLMEIAMLCRQGAEEEDDGDAAPSENHYDKPLPKGVERL